MRRKKGFTLMELLVVIAIFGVLVCVLVPAWASYLQRSKFRAQNQKAKAIFNAAQVVITDIDFSERRYRSRLSDQADVSKYIYTPLDTSEDWYYYWDGVKGFQCNAAGVAVGGRDTNHQKTIDEWNERIGREIKRIVTDDMVYKIWVNDYQIQAIACSDKESSRYIGAHPTTIFELDAKDINTESGDTDLKHTIVKSVDLRWFDLDADVNPAKANAT